MAFADIIYKAFEPKIEETVQKAYVQGGEDMIRRFAFVYDSVAKTARADAYAEAGAINIEEITTDEFDAIVDDMEGI